MAKQKDQDRALSRDRSCGEKIKFKRKEWAEKRLSKLPGLEVYPCKYCKSWHLGHQTRKK